MIRSQENNAARAVGTAGESYRIITRGDFDGLVSAVLFSSLNPVKNYYLTHARAVHSGSVAINNRDVILNLPYHPGCALWFDHHESEKPHVQQGFAGAFSLAPSCARVICDYYSPNPQTLVFRELVEAADKIDSAQLDLADVCNPQGWVLLSNTLQTTAGGGQELSAKDYFIYLVDLLKVAGPDDVLRDREVLQRIVRSRNEQALALDSLSRCTWLRNSIIISDTRKLHKPVYGNRFLIYTLFPDTPLSISIFNKERTGQTIFACARNIFNRQAAPNIGLIMKRFGGGGMPVRVVVPVRHQRLTGIWRVLSLHFKPERLVATSSAAAGQPRRNSKRRRGYTSSIIRAGSSSNCFTRTRKLTDSRPSIMRWS